MAWPSSTPCRPTSIRPYRGKAIVEAWRFDGMQFDQSIEAMGVIETDGGGHEAAAHAGIACSRRPASIAGLFTAPCDVEPAGSTMA